MGNESQLTKETEMDKIEKIKAEYANLTSQELNARITAMLLDGIVKRAESTVDTYKIWKEKDGAAEEMI